MTGKPATPEPCRECRGEGEVWRYSECGGSEYDHRWERCENCNGDGYEPEPEEEEISG